MRCIRQKPKSMKRRLTFVLFTMLCIGNIVAQNISGVVYDSKKEPLTGVSVMVKGSTKGTMTDLDGKFTISNLENASQATLVFNFIG